MALPFNERRRARGDPDGLRVVSCFFGKVTSERPQNGVERGAKQAEKCKVSDATGGGGLGAESNPL